MRLVILSALALFCAAGAAQAQGVSLQLQPGETLLEVEAQGVQLSRPDVMTITAGVVTQGDTAGAALEANSVVANRIIAVIRARNIEARDVRTTELRVSPRYAAGRDDMEEDERSRRIVGYSAANTVELRLRDLTRAPELLDALLQAGANTVEGPRFSLADEAPARRLAQQEAVRIARQEAETYAAALGMRVARVLRLSERGRSVERENYIVVTGSRINRPPVEPGEIGTEVTVWVDFALANR